MTNATVLRFPSADARLRAATGSRPTGRVIPFAASRQNRSGAGLSTHPGNAALAAPHHGLTLGELWAAINEDRLINHYQPQFDFATGRTVALECLARLFDRDGNLITPDRFIVQAEQSGMIVPLGRGVIRQACRDLARWRAQGLGITRVAINLSAHQLQVDTALADFLEHTLDEYGVTHTDLEFELTERQALDTDGPGMETLDILAAAGSRLALDDFGIGYSSVAYLSALDIRTVKLDRSMVSRLPEDRTTAGIVRHLLAMAKELGMAVVAEGIETVAQHDHLAGLGCHLGQGYLVARPMDRNAIGTFLGT